MRRLSSIGTVGNEGPIDRDEREVVAVLVLVSSGVVAVIACLHEASMSALVASMRIELVLLRWHG